MVTVVVPETVPSEPVKVFEPPARSGEVALPANGPNVRPVMAPLVPIVQVVVKVRDVVPVESVHELPAVNPWNATLDPHVLPNDAALGRPVMKGSMFRDGVWTAATVFAITVTG